MPTGYTAAVQSGDVTEFKDFALSCARAFGALITMRDDPMDADIPDEFAPDPYYANALAEAKASLAKLNAMSEDEIVLEAQRSNDDALKSHADYLAEKAEARSRYEVMLAKVRKWEPPTHDHDGLKKFMIEQLLTSIDCDCSTTYLVEPKPMTPTEWLNARREDLTRRIASSEKSHAEEAERCANRTVWVKALRASL
jgi:hypothetical protein